MNNLLVKVVDTSLVKLEYTKGEIMMYFEYHINILWDLAPTSVTNTIKEEFHNDRTNILRVF